MDYYVTFLLQRRERVEQADQLGWKLRQDQVRLGKDGPSLKVEVLGRQPLQKCLAARTVKQR